MTLSKDSYSNEWDFEQEYLVLGEERRRGGDREVNALLKRVGHLIHSLLHILALRVEVDEY